MIATGRPERMFVLCLGCLAATIIVIIIARICALICLAIRRYAARIGASFPAFHAASTRTNSTMENHFFLFPPVRVCAFVCGSTCLPVSRTRARLVWNRLPGDRTAVTFLVAGSHQAVPPLFRKSISSPPGPLHPISMRWMVRSASPRILIHVP